MFIVTDVLLVNRSLYREKDKDRTAKGHQKSHQVVKPLVLFLHDESSPYLYRAHRYKNGCVAQTQIHSAEKKRMPQLTMTGIILAHFARVWTGKLTYLRAWRHYRVDILSSHIKSQWR